MITDILLFFTFLIILLLMSIPLGKYIFLVFTKKKTFLDPILCPLENVFYRLSGVNPSQEMTWKEYAVHLLWFNGFGLLFLYLIQVFQNLFPFNPQNLPGVTPWHLAFNTAASFVTNTNWQAYGGESTLTYFSQMAGLTVQNFVSAGVGLAVAIALIRGLTRRSKSTIGNFWVDLTRSVLWILLPLSILVSLLFIQQGVIQTLSPYVSVQTLEGSSQTIAMGPVASQEAIKLLGTNGGGFFNANSSHPFENPTPFTNFLQVLSIFIIPTSLLFSYGYFTRDHRQGYAILAAMLLLFCLMLAGVYASESYGNPIISQLHITDPTSMEGKEVRFSTGDTALFVTVTTAASCGAVNAMHDSLTPLGGLIPTLQMMLGEVIIGGVGAGFYGMMMYVLLAVFIVGLMVGRTPEYLGKKIEAPEMKMAILAILIPSVYLLSGSALAAVTDSGTSSLGNAGPHGLSEILYAFASGVGNNGSAFGGLTVNTLFYDMAIGFAMLVGRFAVILPVLAIAGSLITKKTAPPGPGTFSTTSLLFVGLLASVVLIVGALTFLPGLSLGPILEHLQMLQLQTYSQ